MTPAYVDVGEIVLRGLPAAVTGEADRLGALVEERLLALAEGRGPATPPSRVSDPAGLADLVAGEIWATVAPHLGDGAAP